MSHETSQSNSNIVQEFQHREKFDIKIAGNGGQGVILAGAILGTAAMYANFSAVQMQSYGAAARGSIVSSDVIIHRTGIVNFPVVKKIDLLVAFTQPTFDELLRKVKPNGLILVDEDLVDKPIANVPVLKLPATQIAQKEMNNKVVANLVMLGGIFHLLGFIPLQAMEIAIQESVPERFCNLNRQAFASGVALATQAFPKYDKMTPTKPRENRSGPTGD